MQPLKVLADNFVDLESKHNHMTWYVWTGAALALLTFAAGLYLFAELSESKAELKAVYFNPGLKMIMEYPASWLPVPSVLDLGGLPRRFEGQSGWFEVSATTGEGAILTEIAAGLNNSTALPFGQNPQIISIQIAGQPGVAIVPTQENVYEAAAVITYPKPVQVDLANYRFLIIRMSKHHLNSLLNSLRLVENKTAEVQGLPNIMVYLPPRRAILASPFNVSGIARVFENRVGLKVINVKNQTIWTGFTAVNAPEAGTYGGWSATVDLAGAEVAVGERIELQVYQNSPQDGSEADKVLLSLQLASVQMTKVVEVYFGSAFSPEGKECDTVYVLERRVAETAVPARAAIEELLKGPTLRERQQGYFTSLPPNVTINKLVIKDGVASVDFSEDLERGVGGSCRVQAIRTQIEKTLKQFSGVDSVVISINGRTEDILQP